MAKGWLRLFNQFSINKLYIHLRQSIIIRFLEDFDGREANFRAFSLFKQMGPGTSHVGLGVEKNMSRLPGSWLV